MADNKKMTDSTLKAIVQQQIESSLAYFGGKIVKDRVKAMQYYYGQPFGNELEGRSQVVSRDVAEIIEAAMPSFMRVFSSGDEVVKFAPSKQGEEEAAQQASDYINWIWNQQNPGFKNIHDWAKDAMLQRVGIIKIWWDTQIDVSKEHYQALTDMQLQILQSDKDIEILSLTSYPDPNAPPMPMGQPPGQGPAQPPQQAQTPQPMLHDAVLRKSKKVGRVKVVPVPQDEFLIEHRAIGLEESEFKAHRLRKSVSDLIAEGYDEQIVKSLPPDEEDYNIERLERYSMEDQLPYKDIGNLDSSTRHVWVYESYINVDYDGDGIAEMRKVTTAGSGHTILDNEEVDNHPFAAFTPILMPHKFFGGSPTDLTMDIQLIKSTLWRQALDNMYLANNSRLLVTEGQVYLDDLLTPRPGGIIRQKQPGQVSPLVTPDITGSVLPMIEYVDSVREKRTGITAYNQGLDADTLNKTAAGMGMIQEAGQQRLELMVRVFAETALKPAFKRILELVCKHQDEAKMIRLRGKWVNMDPREWNDQYDVTIEVGLGTGNKRGEMQFMQQLIQLSQQIIGMQGGVNGPILTLQNVYGQIKGLVEAGGFKNVETFFTDPGNQPYNPPQQQDPKAQAQQQMLAAKTNIEQIKAQTSIQTEQMRSRSAVDIQQMKEMHEAHMNAFKAMSGA